MIEDHFRGYVIWIGRNQDENDELVTKASPEDYWLHLASVPSPHLLLTILLEKESIIKS